VFFGCRLSDVLTLCDTNGTVFSEDQNPILLAVNEGSEVRSASHSILRADGSTLAVEYHVSPLHITGVQVGSVVICADVTERRELETKLARLARFDTVTGLANRVLFYELLDTALDRARRYHRLLAVLFCDLDGFKNVNDVYGHATGDHLLAEIARRLSASVRDSDVVSRLAGDEFAVLLDEVSGPREGGEIAQRIVDAVGQGIVVDGQSCAVSISVGLALFPADADEADALVHAADEAMYTAKRDGKRRWASANSQSPRSAGVLQPTAGQRASSSK
jgi:diguanylate cyclase (GGDEF)-like protein